MIRFLCACCMMAFLAACSQNTTVQQKQPTIGQDGVKAPVPLPRKIGKPYKIAGTWYYPVDDPYYDEVGVASWYGPNFHGKKTANGEIYNMNDLTAAHKTLALPSFVKVTNLQNNRSIILRVNDRGPYVGDRIIDISRRGAQLLGFYKQGKSQVRVQAVDKEGNILRPPVGYVKDLPPKLEDFEHFVQLGAFAQQSSARSVKNKAKAAGTNPELKKVVVNGTNYYRVRLGPYKTRKAADSVLTQIIGLGFGDARLTSERKE